MIKPQVMPGQAQNVQHATSPAQVRRVVLVDGVTDRTFGWPAAALVKAGGSGSRKSPSPLLTSLMALQLLALLLAVVTVREALASVGLAGLNASTVLLLPLCSEPLVTTASEPVQVHAPASTAALSGSAASSSPDVGTSNGRGQSVAACWVPMYAALAVKPCCEGDQRQAVRELDGSIQRWRKPSELSQAAVTIPFEPFEHKQAAQATRNIYGHTRRGG